MIEIIEQNYNIFYIDQTVGHKIIEVYFNAEPATSLF